MKIRKYASGSLLVLAALALTVGAAFIPSLLAAPDVVRAAVAAPAMVSGLTLAVLLIHTWRHRQRVQSSAAPDAGLSIVTVPAPAAPAAAEGGGAQHETDFLAFVQNQFPAELQKRFRSVGRRPSPRRRRPQPFDGGQL